MPKKIWIDLDNSPHVPFFTPIVKELERRGYSVLVTARDAFQVCELAQAAGLKCRIIGTHFGKHKLLKIVGLAVRALQLIPVAAREKPDLAVSHGSRAQLVVSAVTGIPSVLIMDYEYARGLILAKPSWVMVPEPIMADVIHVAKKRVLKYPGIKEDVYVPQFSPDPTIRKALGIGHCELLVTIRPPANEAHYHNPESDKLFSAVLDRLGKQPNVKMVLLPRNQNQGAMIRADWPHLFEDGRIIVPEHAVDGLNLIWNSDFVISGGGTMNREAAALGVPVYSIFRGKIGAVDRYLAANGRLVLLESADAVREKIRLEGRKLGTPSRSDSGSTLKTIVDHIVVIAEGRGAELYQWQKETDQPLVRT